MIGRMTWWAVAAGVCLVVGCNQPKKDPEPYSAAPAGGGATQPLDSYENPSAARSSDALTDADLSGSEMDAPPSEPTRTAARPTAKPAARTSGDEPLRPGGSGKTYVVKKGDTLSGISKKLYGTPNRWREIWSLNKNRVPSPDKLKVGTKLILP